VFPVCVVPSLHGALVVFGVTFFFTTFAACWVPFAVALAASLVAPPAFLAASSASFLAFAASCCAVDCCAADVTVGIPNASIPASAAPANKCLDILPPAPRQSRSVPQNPDEREARQARSA